MASVYVKTSIHKTNIGVIELNRPEALNALSSQLLSQLCDELAVFSTDDTIKCVVLKGSEKAFAAGADIKEMADKSFADSYKENFLKASFDDISQFPKPLIACVSGYALGGGCELAMACDMIIASESAKFGQPEITIGTIPGAGGSQRLTRAVGKSKAMDLCLTGRMMDVQEAEKSGLVARIFSTETLVDETLAIAEKIASFSLPVSMMVKESINKAYETTLSTGLDVERRLFQSTFALDDQKEGMRAFVEKRPPAFKNS